MSDFDAVFGVVAQRVSTVAGVAARVVPLAGVDSLWRFHPYLNCPRVHSWIADVIDHQCKAIVLVLDSAIRFLKYSTGEY